MSECFASCLLLSLACFLNVVFPRQLFRCGLPKAIKKIHGQTLLVDKHCFWRKNIMKKPKVAVVGLKGEQIRTIEERCGRKAHIKCVDQRTNPSKLPDLDHLFLMTRFLPHYWTKAAYRKLRRTSFWRDDNTDSAN